MKTLQEIEARLSQIAEELKKEGITEEQFAALERESNELMEQRAELAAQQRRADLLARIAQGQGQTVRSFQTPAVTPSAVPATPSPVQGQQERQANDPYDTLQYRRAFMEYVCRGTPIPAEYRADALTTTSDASAVIPTTILNEMVKKLESYGSVYAGVRKLNVQGGVDIPILSLKPTATWIGENADSDEQKLQANTKVSFSYYGLECKLAQSLLVSVTTLEMFQREFAALAVEAIIKALEIAIFTGNGTGKPLGVTADSRIPNANKITLIPADFTSWAGWKKNVFAKMKKAYRNGVFFMAQGTFDGYIDGMVDSTGQPIGRVNYGIEGEEKYRFGGKIVETVEDDCIKSYDDASTGDVVAVFMKLSDYAINSNMQMRVVKWEDHDTNEIKNKVILICDGKLIDPNGVLLIKKGAAPAQQGG